jgi:protein involved in polysaccharide export with SLBB domain
MKKSPLVFLLFYIMAVPFVVFAQDAEVSAGAPAALGGAEDDLALNLTPNAQLALSTPDYPVTAGDVYTLAYLAGSQAVDYTITVDTTYRIRVSNLAVVNAAGKTYNELKAQVESIVTTNYPMSGVQFVLKTPAVFKVYIKGEVRTAGEVSAWALARLSSLSGYATAYGSIRSVSVTSTNGTTRTYDLFKARRSGDMTQNPYLRPNDVVTFGRAERRVTVSGAVERPGTYQLLPGENFKDLINFYGNGFTTVADKSRMQMVRYNSSQSISGDRITLKEDDYRNNLVLYDLDSITVPSIADFRPMVPVNRQERRITLQGTVRRPGTYNLMPGENLKDLIEVYGDGFTPLADTSRMQMVRFNSSQSVSGDRITLTEEDYLNNLVLYDLDTITVPSITDSRPVVPVNREERRITLEGAVRRPGTYDLMPGENLKDLIDVYGDGFTAVADKSRMQLVRHNSSQSISGDRITLTEEDYLNNFVLYDVDSITVPSITDFRPVVPVNRQERRITLEGAVRRPGTYDLMPGENLKDLIDVYGDGFTPLADPSGIGLTRFVNSDDKVGNKLYLTMDNVERNFPLEHYDVVEVPSTVNERPVIFVEGAVKTSDEGDLNASNRIIVPFVPGENYGPLVRRNSTWFTAVSDTGNAYIVRDREYIPINLNVLMYDAESRSFYSLEANDTLIVPFRQYFVTVAGAVMSPGRYPYIPDRDWRYYVSLAGGFKRDQNSYEKVTIRDLEGRRMTKNDKIFPETTITAETNAFLYHFNRIAPVVTTFLSLVMTFISIGMSTGSF